MSQPLTDREKVHLFNDTMNSVEAVLHAISAGQLLVNLPADRTYADSHNAACALLDMAEAKIGDMRQKLGERSSDD